MKLSYNDFKIRKTHRKKFFKLYAFVLIYLFIFCNLVIFKFYFYYILFNLSFLMTTRQIFLQWPLSLTKLLT